MTIDTRIKLLIAALSLVEFATGYKLALFFRWTYQPFLAVSTAAVFVVLLLVAIIALGSDITPEMRKWLHIAGLWMFIVQSLAVVLTSYQYGMTVMPVYVVTEFFPFLGPDMALRSISIIQGLSLSIISVKFWNTIGYLLRRRWEQHEQNRVQLQELEELLRKES